MAAPSLGSIRVNDTEYDGRIVIECYDYFQGDAPQWAVPAWDESGVDGLSGDVPIIVDGYEIARSWSSRAKAEAAIRRIFA